MYRLNGFKYRLAQQHGTTLVELVVAMPLFTLVLGGAYGAYIGTVNQHLTVKSRTETVAQQEDGLERIGRSLRRTAPPQPSAATTFFIAGTGVEFLECGDAGCTPAGQRWVRFDCTDPDGLNPGKYACARREATLQQGRIATRTANPTMFLEGVAPGGAQFIYDPVRQLVSISIRVDVKGNAASHVTLSDKIALRNLIEGA